MDARDIGEQFEKNVNSPKQSWLLGAGVSFPANIPLMIPLTKRVLELALRDVLFYRAEYQKAHEDVENNTKRIRMAGGSRVDPGAHLAMRARRDTSAAALKDAADRVEQAGALIEKGMNPDGLSQEALAADMTNHLVEGVVLTPGAVATLPELQRVGFYCAK